MRSDFIVPATICLQNHDMWNIEIRDKGVVKFVRRIKLNRGCFPSVILANDLVLSGGISQLTFHVLLTSQDQAGPLLQVLSHFMTSKSLF